jgi:hypothetical protein
MRNDTPVYGAGMLYSFSIRNADGSDREDIGCMSLPHDVARAILAPR